MYSQPAGASVPRVSRIVQLPECAASMADCDPNLTVFADFGWDACNRLAALRDTLTARATIAGLIDPADGSHWQQMTYDSDGRVVSTQTPSPVTDRRGRLAAEATAVVSESVYSPAEAVFAPATQQVAVTTTGAGGSLTSTTAVDDGGRVIGARAASGGVTRSVWAPFDDLQLATIYPNEQARGDGVRPLVPADRQAHGSAGGVRGGLRPGLAGAGGDRSGVGGLDGVRPAGGDH